MCIFCRLVNPKMPLKSDCKGSNVASIDVAEEVKV